MLTGVLPFSVRTPFDRLRREAPRPSKSHTEVPAELDAIIAKCLSRSRTDRFSSAEEVLDALDAMSSRVSRVAPRRRRPFGAAAAGAFAAALVGYAALKSHAAHGVVAAAGNPAPHRSAPAATPQPPIEHRATTDETTYGDPVASAPAVPSPEVPRATQARRSLHAPSTTRDQRVASRLFAEERRAAGAPAPVEAPPVPATTVPDGDRESTTVVAASADPGAQPPPAEPQDASARKKPEAPTTAKPPVSKTSNEHGFLNPFQHSSKP
jgi:hypothetical protein